jgi:hypothetical protein
MMHQNDLTPDYMVQEVQPRVWTGEDRRGIDGITLKLMAEVRATLEKHEKMEEGKFDELKDDLKAHQQASHQRHKELTERIDAMSQSTMNVIHEINQTAKETHALFKRSIPNEDPEGHRRAHEAWIKKSDQEEKFWLDLKKNVVNWIAIAVVSWIGLVLWAAFLKGPSV